MAFSAELAIVAGRVDLLLERARAAPSIAERRFALDALARGLLFADPGSVDAATRSAALELRVDPSAVAMSQAPRQPHAVGVPLVESSRGFAFVRQVHVAFDPVGLLGSDPLLESGAQRAIASAILAAAERASPPSDPARHRLVPAQPGALEQVRVDGPSLGAATFVSAIALWTERPVRAQTVVTGALRGRAVVSVGAMNLKVRAAHEGGARAIVVPGGDARAALEAKRDLGADLEVLAVDDLDALLAATLEATPPKRVSPDRAVLAARDEFAQGWRGYRWPSIRESLSRLGGTLPAERVGLRVEVLARLAAAQRHLGDPVGSLALLEEAEAITLSKEGRDGVPDEILVYLLQQHSMTCRQLCRFGEASKVARRSARVAKRARLRRLHIRSLGCVGLVALSRGDVPRAITAFEESLEVTLGFEPDRTARSRAYLIEAYGAAGRADAARAHFEAAMEEIEGERRDQESWVRTSWAGALIALGRPEEAVTALDVDAIRRSLEDEPLPGLLARRWLGLALARTGEPARAFEVLAASPVVHGRALAPHLGFLAHLNVLFEAAARRRAGAWGPDIAGRATRALDAIPRYGRVETFVGEPMIAVGDALERGRLPSLRSLEALLRRCVRLG